MLRKKKSLIIILALAIVLVHLSVSSVVVGNIINKFRYLTHDVYKYELPNFDMYKSSFKIMANKAIEVYELENKNNDIRRICLRHIIDYDTNELRYLVYPVNGDKGQEKTLFLTDEEANAIKNIQKAFAESYYEHNGLLSIGVNDKQVSFIPYSRSGIVLMRKIGRPSYITTEKEDYDSLYIDYLGGKWFFVVGDPN